MLALLEAEAAKKDEQAEELLRLHLEYLEAARQAQVVLPSLTPELPVSSRPRRRIRVLVAAVSSFLFLLC